MNIEWQRQVSYQGARAARGVVYLHEWNGSPFYWGEAKEFGIRYSLGYAHWIEGVLQHGGRLYTGKPDALGAFTIGDVQDSLIETFGSTLNKRKKKAKVIPLTHSGNVPESILRPGVT